MNALQLFPFSFHTGVTAQAPRANIDRKSAILHQRGHFDPKFQVQGVALVQNRRFSIYVRSWRLSLSQ